jgi:hypothetical protein
MIGAARPNVRDARSRADAWSRPTETDETRRMSSSRTELTPVAAPAARRPSLRSVLLGALAAGLTAGTIDVFAAALINHARPDLILRAIASGVWGRWAFQAPAWMPAAGIGLQWAMSVVIALIFALAAWRWDTLRRRPVVWGLAYGVGVFLVMNLVVVPLSNASHRAHVTPLWLAENILAMLLFGVIIAGIVAAFLNGEAVRDRTPL